MFIAIHYNLPSMILPYIPIDGWEPDQRIQGDIDSTVIKKKLKIKKKVVSKKKKIIKKKNSGGGTLDGLV